MRGGNLCIFFFSFQSSILMRAKIRILSSNIFKKRYYKSHKKLYKKLWLKTSHYYHAAIYSLLLSKVRQSQWNIPGPISER